MTKESIMASFKKINEVVTKNTYVNKHYSDVKIILQSNNNSYILGHYETIRLVSCDNLLRIICFDALDEYNEYCKCKEPPILFFRSTSDKSVRTQYYIKLKSILKIKCNNDSIHIYVTNYKEATL